MELTPKRAQQSPSSGVKLTPVYIKVIQNLQDELPSDRENRKDKGRKEGHNLNLKE